MKGEFIPFDAVRRLAVDAIKKESLPENVLPLYLIRDLLGRVRLAVSDAVEADETCLAALRSLADRLYRELGAHGYPPDKAVLFPNSVMLQSLKDTRQKVAGLDRVYWVDRMLTGKDWQTVGEPRTEGASERFTLFSIKGGVGRSTTAAVLAWHLTRRGERVLVVDLDLESPGLSSAMLDSRSRPRFGVSDWFVEDMVEQGGRVLEQMTAAPSWVQDFEGDARIAPAHGNDPGEYMAKLGRVYMDAPGASWTTRLNRLLELLETDFEPTVVLLESRSGLHDIAAATVTDLDAQVLLFAIDAESHWTDYDILFRHWQERDLRTTKRIRERLSIVSALTPEIDTERYLQGFRERAWNLFRERLYDQVDPSSAPGEGFSFDLSDEDAPHDPLAVHWTRGLAAGTSLHDLEQTPVAQAYTQFLRRFDRLRDTSGDGAAL